MVKKSKLTPLAGLFIAGTTLLMIATGCIDDRYDIGGNKLNTDVTFGGEGLALPIGTSPKYTIKDIFGDAKHLLVVDENGVYSVGETGSISSTFQLNNYNNLFEIELGSVPPISFPPTLPGGIAATPSATIIPSVAIAIPLLQSSLSSKIPFADDITDIKALEIIPTIAQLSLTLDLPTTLRKKCKIENLVLTFPGFIKTGLPGNKITVSYNFAAGTTCNISFPIQGVDELTWYQAAMERGVKVNGNLTFSGGQLIATNATAGELKSISSINFNLDFNIPEIGVKSITGIFVSDIEEVDKEINLSDIPDFLEGTTLGLENGILKIEIENPVMTPFVTTIMEINGVSIGALLIAKATSETVPMKNRFWIAAKAPTTEELGDYVFYHVPNLTSIFDPLQPRLNIKAKFATVNDGIADKVKTTPYTIPFNYEVLIPLSVSEDFRISDEVKIEELGSILTDLKRLNPNTSLTTTFTNSIPLNLEAKLIPKDGNNQIVDGVVFGDPLHPIVVKGAISDTEAAISVAELTITETEPNALESVNSIDVQFTITGRPGQRNVMRLGQSLSVKLSAKLPGGITTTL